MEPKNPFTNIPNHLRHGDIYDIEKQNLEAHVAICVQRYNALHQHIQDGHDKLCLKIDTNTSQISQLQKAVFWCMGVLFVTLFGAIITQIIVG